MSDDADTTQYYVKATDPTNGAQVAFACANLAIANAKAAELRMCPYQDVIISLAKPPEEETSALCVPNIRFGSCPYRNLYPAVLVMQSAEDWLSSELAEPLDRSMARRILAQGQMRSECVVIAGVVCKDSAQVGFAEYDSVIKAFPADQADQSLRMPVLPG